MTTTGGNGISRTGRGERLKVVLALAALLAFAIPAPASAQMVTDHGRPWPLVWAQDLSPPAMNLAPPSGPASIPSLPAPLTQPSIAVAPPVAAPPAPSSAGQAVLSLTARYGKDLPVITSGLVWRGGCR